MKCPTIKVGDQVRIITAVDANGNKFIPVYVNYKVLHVYDNEIVDIGIGSVVKHTLPISNIRVDK